MKDWPPKRAHGLGDIAGCVQDEELLRRLASGRVKPEEVGILSRATAQSVASPESPEGKLHRQIRDQKNQP